MKTGKSYSRLGTIPAGTISEDITPGCIVLEGGAFRGIYTQGYLDYLMKHKVNMQAMVGVSAGALSAVSYKSGQIGRSARANLGYRHESNYIGLDAMRRSGSPIRLDFLIKDYDEIEPLDRDRFFDKSRRFVAVATNCRTGEPEFFEHDNCSEIMQAIKASASMPFISRMVDVEGRKCLDGGCSCAVPYQWAIDQGYEKIIVIKTHEHGFRLEEPKVKSTARKVYRNHAEFAKVLDESDIRYNEQYDELDRLAEKGRIFLVEPSAPVTVARVEGDVEKLGRFYWLGYHDAESGFGELCSYLGIDNPNPCIRDAIVEDAGQIVDIYSPYVTESAVTFDLEVPSVEDFRQRIQNANGYPFLVSEKDGRLYGFAYAHTYYGKAAYAHSAELTIYIRKDVRGNGVGKSLYQELEHRLKAMGVSNLYACITVTDDPLDMHLTNASTLFHEALGFKTVGHFHSCGKKFDTYYDTVWMEKILEL